MHSPVAWLPKSALLEVRTAAPVAEVVAQWSRAWLAFGTVSVAPRWEPAIAGSGVAGLRPLSEIARPDFAKLLLGRDLSERGLRTADEAIIAHLVDAAWDELALDLAALLGDRDSIGTERFTLPISSEDGTVLMNVEAGRETLVGLVKQWTLPARPGEKVVPLASTLGDQSVRLAARLGASRLALPDIEALGAGDVLLLDTPLTEAVTAWIDERAAAEAALTVSAADEKLQLQIVRPASQW